VARDLTYRQQGQGAAETDEPQGAPGQTCPAFREVYERHFSYVWNSLRRLGVAAQDLEDLVQEVFEDVFEKLHTSYDPNRPIRPWLFGVALRIVLNNRKRLGRRREVTSDWSLSDRADPVDPGLAADLTIEIRQKGELVKMALESLELDRRAVFVMSEIAGHTMPEIAQALSVPLNTAYSRLRLARRDFEVAVRRQPRGGKAP
jgi:RNA polymerase sigma-70 factor (ECF subfamily)